jgi:hypothetical protein
MFEVGGRIERCIEDMWFAAIIEGVNLTRKLLKIRFLDDGNVEEGVPMADCRRCDEDNGSSLRSSFEDMKINEEFKDRRNGIRGSAVGDYEYAVEGKGSGFDSKWGGTTPPRTPPSPAGRPGACISKSHTLRKPLFGLIEDDCHIRQVSMPVVTLHDSTHSGGGQGVGGGLYHNSKDANAEVDTASMAAGGGLRALRFLKDKA